MRADGEGRQCPYCLFRWAKNLRPGRRSRRRHLKRCTGFAAHEAGNVYPPAAPPEIIVPRESDDGIKSLGDYYYDENGKTAEATATLVGRDLAVLPRLGQTRGRTLRLGQALPRLRAQPQHLGGPLLPGNLLHPIRVPIVLGDPIGLLRDWFQWPQPGVDLLPVVVHRPPALYLPQATLETLRLRQAFPRLRAQPQHLGGPLLPGNLLHPIRVPIFLGDPLGLLRGLFQWPEPGVDLLPVVVHRPPALYLQQDPLQRFALVAALIAGWFTRALSVAQAGASSWTFEDFSWVISTALDIGLTCLDFEMERARREYGVVLAWVLLSMGLLGISFMLFVRDFGLDSPWSAPILGAIELAICFLNMAFVAAGEATNSSARHVARVLITVCIRILWRVAVRIARRH